MIGHDRAAASSDIKAVRTPADCARILRRRVLIALSADLILFFVKLYIGVSSSSVAIYSDAINNLLDAISCLMCVAAAQLMAKPARPGFPDGYARAEDVCSFLMSILILLTGVYVGYTSLDRLLYPRPVTFQVMYAVLIALGAAVKLGLFLLFRRFYNRKLDSDIFRTISQDSLADFFSTCVILLSFAVTHFGKLQLDAAAGMAMSVFIIINAVRLIRSSVISLMGGNDKKTAEKLRSVLGNDCTIVRCGKTWAAVEGELGDEALAKAENETGIRIFAAKRR